MEHEHTGITWMPEGCCAAMFASVLCVFSETSQWRWGEATSAAHSQQHVEAFVVSRKPSPLSITARERERSGLEPIIILLLGKKKNNNSAWGMRRLRSADVETVGRWAWGDCGGEGEVGWEGSRPADHRPASCQEDETIYSCDDISPAPFATAAVQELLALNLK